MPTRSSTVACEIRKEFRAPLDFVYEWCTDYSPDDASLEKEAFQRRVLRRTKKEVVYEDLDSTPDGWHWARWSVRLHPPDRWHAESVGNYRAWSVEYRLRALPNGRTEFHFKGRRTPAVLARSGPSRADVRANLLQVWKRFGRALESEYRKQRR
jgi:hypothetical protein